MTLQNSTKKTVLLIDDNKEYIEMLSLVLRKKYNIIPVSSLQLLKDSEINQLDAVVLDYHIGIYTAEDILNHLKEKKIFNDDIPVILITGSVNVEDLKESLNLTAFLEKPFRNADIKRVLEEVLTNP